MSGVSGNKLIIPALEGRVTPHHESPWVVSARRVDSYSSDLFGVDGEFAAL